MDKELEVLHALNGYKNRLCDRFVDMTQALAKISSDLTPEEDSRYNDLLRKFAEFGSRSIAAEVDFDQLWKKAKTREDRLLARDRGVAALERDIEELKGFIFEMKEIQKAHQ
jgi:hypothetical protein